MRIDGAERKSLSKDRQTIYGRVSLKLTSKLHRLLTTSVWPGSLCVRQNMARWPAMAYSGRRTHWGCWQRLLTTSIMPVALCRLKRKGETGGKGRLGRPRKAAGMRMVQSSCTVHM